MQELSHSIRNAARALIIQQDKILLLCKKGAGRAERYTLPGGAQEPGESLIDALNRECLEEIDTTVDAAELVYVADFIKQRDTHPPTKRHIVDFLFRCEVPDDYFPRSGEKPDKNQVGVKWIAMSELHLTPLVPQYLSHCIPALDDADRTFYLGKLHDRPDS